MHVHMDNYDNWRKHVNEVTKLVANKAKEKRIKEYDKIPNKCTNCHIVLQYNKRKNKFCSRSCSATYSNLNRQYVPSKDKQEKIGNCRECNKEIKVNFRSNVKNILCDKCKILLRSLRNGSKILKNEKICCRRCGQEICKRPKICKRQNFDGLSKYFGFDLNVIGTKEIYREYDRIKTILEEDYISKHLSGQDMVDKYNHLDAGSMISLLQNLGIKTRTLTEAYAVAYDKNKFSGFSGGKYQYNHGWHKTWNGNKVFYRSSYELDQCKIFDKQKTYYEMENLRILYWDTQLIKERNAIPDFYLPESNTIIEIKSDWTYDEQNMKDKVKEYKKHGYKFKLILEHKEVKI